jgi:hypothetical protein
METIGLRVGGGLTQGRVGYTTMKTWLLDAYYEFCRNQGARLKWWHEIVLRSATHEHAEHLPIERVMLCVVQLVLSGGRYPEADSQARRWIVEQFERHGFTNLIVALPAEEATAFHRDLESLQLV